MLQTSQHKRVLLPFTDSRHLAQTLEPALNALGNMSAGFMSAELLLLRVHPAVTTTKNIPDEENLYSELRGIQARLQGQDVPVQIDTVAGPPVRSILAYAGRHNIDLIVLSGGEENKQGITLAERVARRALCETLVIGN